MFDAFCERCATTVLLGPRQIVSLENTDDGIVLTFRCTCGETGVQLFEVPARRSMRPTAEQHERRHP